MKDNDLDKKETGEKESLLVSIIDSSEDAILSQDKESRITSWNRGAEKTFGYTAAEVLGKKITMLIPEEKWPEETSTMKQILSGESMTPYETLRIKKDGSVIPIFLKASAIRNRRGEIIGVSKIGRDLTQIKQANELVIQNEMRLRNTLDIMLEGIQIIGFDWKYLYVNVAFTQHSKYTKEELIGFTVMEKFPGIENTEIYKVYQKCFKDRVSIQLENEFLFPDGSKGWFQLSFQPVPEGISIQSVDITERKKAEATIEESEKRLRKIIENSYDIVAILDKDFKPFYRSPSSERITGWSSEEREVTNNPQQLLHPDDVEAQRKVMMEVIKNPGIPIPVSLRTIHKDGHYLHLEGIMTNMLDDPSVKGVITNFQDVTRYKIAEEIKSRSERLYKSIASGIPGTVICLFDKDYRYQLIEGDMLEKLGYAKEDLLGKLMKDVVTPERYREMVPSMIRVFNGEIFTTEGIRGEYAVTTRFVPFRDDNNQVYAAMLAVIDVTELKKAQKHIEEMNTTLEQKVIERTAQVEAINKELEAFSYSISHDLRAPLRAINGYAAMLEEDFSKVLDGEGMRQLRIIQNNAKRMGQLIDDLLAFSRLGRKEVQKSKINMKELALNVVEEIKFNHPESEIIINDLHQASGDLSLIKQVLHNYISNAAKYSSRSAKSRIEVTSYPAEGEFVFSVKDNGIGFDMNYYHKLFKVFQRLHSREEFEGTGVGLAIVDRIITKHGGKVWAEGEPSRGSIFYFSLPA